MIGFAIGSDNPMATAFADGSSFPQRIDLWLLNLFPRGNELTGHAYSTLNFVPAMVTMLMGLICGELLRRADLTPTAKLKRLVLTGVVCLLLALAWSPLCPIVKKLWTPSWTLFSGAYVIWWLALLYWLVDIRDWSWGWAQFFVIIGMNSIAAYFMGQLLKPWTRGVLSTHLPDTWLEGNWGPFWQATLVALCFWIMLWWMYRNRIFIRVK